MIDIQVKLIEDDSEDFLYPEYCAYASLEFVKQKEYLLNGRTVEETASFVYGHCMTSPRVELYAIKDSTIVGHIFLCPGEDMHYGDVTEIRTTWSVDKEATTKLYKTALGIAQSLSPNYLCRTSWREDGSYVTKFIPVGGNDGN